jgi:hypothetical protein
MCYIDYIFDDELWHIMAKGRENEGGGEPLGASDPTFLKREKFGLFSNESALFIS